MQNISFHSISDSQIPIAITDIKLTLQYGNKSLYTLIGNDLFYSIYKVVHPNERTRLTECIENITNIKNITSIFSILYSDNEYYHMLLNFTYIKNYKLIKIEFQYLSDIKNEHSRLEYEIKKYRTLFTLDGDNIFEYSPKTNYFKFYWINDTQNIIQYCGDFSVWKENILENDFIANVDKSVFMELCQSIENCNESFEYQLTSSILTNGETFESTKVKGITIKDNNDNKLVLGVWLFYNIIYHNKENRFIDHIYKDELTGLLNKHEITKYAQNILKNKPDHTVYMLILDLDNFKQCNDTFGHMFGDEILRDVANILKNTVQQQGVAGRIGGDEFLIILENIESEKLLCNMLRSIRANIQWLYRNKLSSIHLGCSVGVSCYPNDSEEYDTLFKLADYCLYLAKNTGKGRYIIYDYNLHGPVTCNTNDNSILTKKNSSASITLLDVKKKIAKLYCNGEDAILDVLETLKSFFDIPNIAIYIPNSDSSHLASLYKTIVTDLPILFYEDYLTQFNETEVYLVTNIKNLEFTFSNVYNYFAENSSTSFYQCLLKDSKDTVKGIISYERSNDHDTWSNDTIQILSLVSSIIGCIVFDNK